MKLLLLLTLGAAAFASPCASVSTVAQLSASGACTLGGVSLSNFQASGVDPNTVVSVAMNSGGSIGLTFEPAGGISGDFSVSYKATCLSGLSCISGVADSAASNFAGSAKMYYTIASGGGSIGSSSQAWNGVLVAAEVTNTGHFYSDGTTQIQAVTLNLNVHEPDVRPTPEPLSRVLVGSALIGLWFVGRKRHA